MLDIKSLTKNFGKNVAVRDFSFTFDNEIYGLLGPNGAGKTTLMRCMAGLCGFKGSISENGVEISKLKENQRNIGYLPQKFGMFPNLTVREMLEYFCIQKNVKISRTLTDEYAEIVGLEQKVNSRISSLSGGMIRRLGIVQALISDPALIIFDEPTAGLDPEERMRFKSIVQNLRGKCTVILSTHIVADVGTLCDKIIIMDKGLLLFSGSVDDTAKLAEGKIYIVDERDITNIKCKYHVIQTLVGEQSSTKLRIAAQEKLNLQVVPACVEDGYICCIKDI